MTMRTARERCLPNPAAHRGPYPAQLKAVLSAAHTDEAVRTMSEWGGYSPTPLRDLPALATQLDIHRLWYKDESRRFNGGSFKALGGAYAVHRLLRDCADPAGVTFACATAGNHGVSVAWASKQLGAHCVVYVPDTVPQERAQLLRDYGAEIRIVGTSYDDAVHTLAVDAQRNGWCVVSDTAYDGYTDIPADVMRGYTVLVREILDQLPSGEEITHVFLQCGVGGLASAVVAHFWEKWGSERPTTVVVEADSAACFYESVRRGAFSQSPSQIDTRLVCLACARLSSLAWPILRGGADFALTISDDAAFEAMRTLARMPGSPIIAGESGAAGLGGLLSVHAEPSFAKAIGISRDSHVLIIGSEGALNPSLYREITGGDFQA